MAILARRLRRARSRTSRKGWESLSTSWVRRAMEVVLEVERKETALAVETFRGLCCVCWRDDAGAGAGSSSSTIIIVWCCGLWVWCGWCGWWVG